MGLNPVKINIRAETTKTGEKAPIKRLSEDLRNVIRQAYILGSKHKTTHLFCTKLSRKCSRNSVRVYLKKVSGKIIGTEITPHYFRHRFLTECGKKSVPIVDAMEMAGIRDIKVVTAYYAHSTDVGMDKVLEATAI